MSKHEMPGFNEHRVRAVIESLEKETPGVEDAWNLIQSTAAFGAVGAPRRILEEAGCWEGAMKLVEQGLAVKTQDEEGQEVVALQKDSVRAIGSDMQN